MYAEDELQPISALQHLAFCERQWGLIHLEGVWRDNRLTAEGNLLHERADEPAAELRGDLLVVRGLLVRSLLLGLTGRLDVVEFHRTDAGAVDGAILPGREGRWCPFPVEYKRGREKAGDCDRVQLCAQALCLEEMLGVTIPAGALFYGTTRRRSDTPFTLYLRAATRDLAARLHRLAEAQVTPPPRYGPHCAKCSIEAQCMPSLGKSWSVRSYLDVARDRDSSDKNR